MNDVLVEIVGILTYIEAGNNENVIMVRNY